MRRIIYTLPGLFIFLLIPYRAFALSCTYPETVQYFLECQANVCDGFKIQEEWEGGVCNLLPYVADLDLNEVENMAAYLQNIDRLEEMNDRQQFIATLPANCASTVQTHSQSFIEVCTQYRETTIEPQNDLQPLADWRQAIELATQAERRNYYLGIYTQTVVSFVLSVLLPLGIVVENGSRNHPNLGNIAISMFVWQFVSLCIIFYFGIFSGWPIALFYSVIVAIVLEIICLIRHKTKQKRLAKTT